MKLIIKNRRLMLAFTVLFTLFSTGCQKSDGDIDFGLQLIYMPQATVTGTNNHYVVPSGAGIYTYNFRVDKGNGKLNVILSVLRSGKFSNAQGFMVNVGVSQAETNMALDIINNAVALPASMYTLPDNVTVKNGNNSAAFYLSVDINKLMDGTYNGKNLVLGVMISNPTMYELSEKNTSVKVIIDVDAMRSILYP